MSVCGMYPLKPVFDLDLVVEVPACMYRLPVIQSSQPIQFQDGGTAGQAPSALAALSARQDSILARLEQLKEQVARYQDKLGLPIFTATTSLQAPSGRTGDLVVRCSPSHPPYSLPALVALLQDSGLTVHTSCHAHSSVPSLAANLLSFLPATQAARATAKVRLTVIWSSVGRDCELLVSPLTQSVIRGEVNVLRYFARLFPSVLPYESLATSQDLLLDSISSLAWAPAKARQPLVRQAALALAKTPYLAGPRPGASDLALYSVVHQLGLQEDLQPEVKKWFSLLSSKFPGTATGSGQAKVSTKAKSPIKEIKYSPAKEVKKEKKASGKPTTPAAPAQAKNEVGGHLSKEGLFAFFTAHGIEYSNVEHPEVFTVEAMMPYLSGVEGAICKNLFLKDKKKNLYLLSAAHDREVKLNDVAKAVGAKELRFGDSDVMLETLGVTQGCVTAFALVNDTKKCVKFLVDSALMDGSHARLNFHPMVNTATTGVSTEHFAKFLKTTGHTVVTF